MGDKLAMQQAALTTTEKVSFTMAKNDSKVTAIPVLADNQQTGGPTATQLKQAEMLLSEIATQAGLIDELCYHGATEGNGATEDDLAHYATQMRVVRQMVQLIGWMADKGTGKLSGSNYPTVKGGSERWLMHPLYAKTLERGSAQ